MSDYEICKNEFVRISAICNFFFDRAIDVSLKNPPQNAQALATYAKWRDRETKAHRIMLAHLFSR